MAIKHIDGFEQYTTIGDSASNIATYLIAAGYGVQNASNSTFQLSAGQEVGSMRLKLITLAASGTPPSFSWQFVTAADLVVWGFAFKGTQSRIDRIARINNAVDVQWDPTTGKLKIGAVQGQDVIIMNADWHIDIEVDKATMKIRVWANDVQQLEADLPGGAAGTTHSIQWGMTGAQAANSTLEIDDFHVIDNSGGAINARVGPTQIVTRAPTADVTTEWNLVGSTGTHYSVAAQLSPNAANAPYLQANVAGKTDRFSSNTVLPNDNQIFAVSLVSYARKGDLDERALGLAVGTVGGETETQIPLTTDSRYREAIYEKAPGNVDWTQGLVESSTMAIIAR